MQAIILLMSIDDSTDKQSYAEIASAVHHRRVVKVGQTRVNQEAEIIIEHRYPDDSESKH